MKQYSILKSDNENFSYILDVLKMLLGNNIHIEEHKDFLLLEHKKTENEFEDTIKSLESDLNILISYYQTGTDRPEKELSLICEAFLMANYGHYDLKSFIPSIQSRKLKLDLFQFITEGIGITEEIIYAMAESDLNVSLASTKLYMHRNTLLYKIERLNDLRSFDLKKFYDLYLLIYLLKA